MKKNWLFLSFSDKKKIKISFSKSIFLGTSVKFFFFQLLILSDKISDINSKIPSFIYTDKRHILCVIYYMEVLVSGPKISVRRSGQDVYVGWITNKEIRIRCQIIISSHTVRNWSNLSISVVPHGHTQNKKQIHVLNC